MGVDLLVLVPGQRVEVLRVESPIIGMLKALRENVFPPQPSQGQGSIISCPSIVQGRAPMDTHFDDFVFGKMFLVAAVFTILVYERGLLNYSGDKWYGAK